MFNLLRMHIWSFSRLQAVIQGNQAPDTNQQFVSGISTIQNVEQFNDERDDNAYKDDDEYNFTWHVANLGNIKQIVFAVISQIILSNR